MPRRRDILVTLFTSALSSALAALSGCTEKTSGGGGGNGQSAPPASFSFDYDDNDRQLTVIHDGGSRIPAKNLYLRGSGIEETGSWTELGGDTSGPSDDGPTVGTADTLTVGAASDFQARLVWESGNVSHPYKEESGPDA